MIIDICKVKMKRGIGRAIAKMDTFGSSLQLNFKGKTRF